MAVLPSKPKLAGTRPASPLTGTVLRAAPLITAAQAHSSPHPPSCSSMTSSGSTERRRTWLVALLSLPPLKLRFLTRAPVPQRRIRDALRGGEAVTNSRRSAGPGSCCSLGPACA